MKSDWSGEKNSLAWDARGRPDIQRVRLPFLVKTAVSQARKRTAVPLIEAPGARVLLKDPELESHWPLKAHLCKQLRPGLCVEARGMDIEVFEPIFSQRRETDNAIIPDGNKC